MKVDDHARRLLRSHRAWPAISFVPELNEDRCVQLVATILDPRWYVDLAHPGRGSKLRAAMGLDIKTMRGVLGLGPKQRLHERCALVLNTWRNADNPKLIEKPDHFLYRVMRDVRDKGKSEEMAILRASQMFLDYVRLVWLAALNIGPHQREALFVPEYFFNQKYEVTAFHDHVRKVIGL